MMAAHIRVAVDAARANRGVATNMMGASVWVAIAEVYMRWLAPLKQPYPMAKVHPFWSLAKWQQADLRNGLRDTGCDTMVIPLWNCVNNRLMYQLFLQYVPKRDGYFVSVDSKMSDSGVAAMPLKAA